MLIYLCFIKCSYCCYYYCQSSSKKTFCCVLSVPCLPRGERFLLLLLRKPIFILMTVTVVFAYMWFWPPLHSQIYCRGRGHRVHTGTCAKSPWASYMLRSWAAWPLPSERHTTMGRVSIPPKCPWGSELPEQRGQARELSHLTRSQVGPQCSEDSGLPMRDADLTSQPPLRPRGQGAEDSGSVLWLGLTTAQRPLFLPTSSDTHPVLAVGLSPTSSHSLSQETLVSPWAPQQTQAGLQNLGVFRGWVPDCPYPLQFPFFPWQFWGTNLRLSAATLSLMPNPSTVFGFHFETGFCQVAQANFELLCSPDRPWTCNLPAGVTEGTGSGSTQHIVTFSSGTSQELGHYLWTLPVGSGRPMGQQCREHPRVQNTHDIEWVPWAKSRE